MLQRFVAVCLVYAGRIDEAPAAGRGRRELVWGG